MAERKGDVGKLAKALELERINFIKAAEEIGEEVRQAEKAAIADLAARGLSQSGMAGQRISSLHHDRAKKMVERMIAFRRRTLEVAPEAATEALFLSLLKSAEETIEGVLKSIPQHIGRRGLPGSAINALLKRDEIQAHSLKAFARREIDIMRREFELRKEAVATQSAEAKDKRKVFVVHGRNTKARNAMFAFLRSINLNPIEWGEALAMTGKATPYVGEVLDTAFSEAQAVVVLVTGDDVARLGTRYVEPNDPPEETEPTPQARPNVLFEAGMAMGRSPERTVIVVLGKTRPFSDIFGRHLLHIGNDPKRRQGLADRLKTAGCDVVTDHRQDWQTEGDFDAANEDPDSAAVCAR